MKVTETKYPNTNRVGNDVTRDFFTRLKKILNGKFAYEI